MFANLDELAVDTALVDPKEQEREEWFAKRAGKFTCSRFGELMTTGRKKDELFGATALSYIYQIVAERLGSWSFGFDSSSTKWGTENESAALAEYFRRTDTKPESVGVDCYCELSEYCGGTPDALVLDGCCEVKCPYSPAEHVRTLHSKTVPNQYQWQVHGHLLVTGREWCDFISFDPRVESAACLGVVRVERDESKIAFLRERIGAAQELAEQIRRAIS